MKFLPLLAIASAIFFSSSALVLECNFDYELLFDDLKVSYTCTVEHLITNETKRYVSEIHGKHIENLKHGDITQLHIIHQSMEYFPRGFTKYFENIVAVHAGMNKLKYLERNDIKDFKKMRYLYLYSNLLEVLNSDVFQDNTALEYISFYNNRLTNIGSKILSPLKKLKTAYFNKNICIDKQAVSSEQGISELRLEIALQCSDITDEDLMRMLKNNEMKVDRLESKVNEISAQLSSAIKMLETISYARFENSTE